MSSGGGKRTPEASLAAICAARSSRVMRFRAKAQELRQRHGSGGILPDALIKIIGRDALRDMKHRLGLDQQFGVPAVGGDPLAEAVRDQILGRGHEHFALGKGNDADALTVGLALEISAGDEFDADGQGGVVEAAALDAGPVLLEEADGEEGFAEFPIGHADQIEIARVDLAGGVKLHHGTADEDREWQAAPLQHGAGTGQKIQGGGVFGAVQGGTRIRLQESKSWPHPPSPVCHCLACCRG